MPNDFADAFYVCRSYYYGTYASLEDALSDAENFNDSVSIYIYESGSYTISSHTFNNSVYIYVYDENAGTITIDGNGATIQSNYMIEFYDDYENHKLEIKNVNFISNYFYDNEFLYVEYFKDVEISNVSVKALDTDSDWVYGIYLYENYGTNIIDSFSAEGVIAGIYVDYCSATVQNSDLTGVIYSVYVDDASAKLINNELSFIYLEDGGSIKIDDLGDKTIKFKNLNFNSPSEWDQWVDQLHRIFNNKEYENYLFINYYNDGMGSSQIKKSMTIKDNSFDLLDVWFYDNGYRISDFDIENFNDEVVSIEDGVVKPLKGGKSTIILTDKNTGHEYRLSLTVDIPKNDPAPIIVNPKTMNSLIVVGFVLLFMIGSLGTMIFKKQH